MKCEKCQADFPHLMPTLLGQLCPACYAKAYPLNPTHKDLFRQAYIDGLAKAVRDNPKLYVYPVTQVPEVAAKMLLALDAGTANVTNSVGFSNACKTLGIRYTAKAIKEYWNS